jgi:DNA-binding response OmpR family regulator
VAANKTEQERAMKKHTLLIVDDELVVRRLLGDALRRAGYEVEVASCGAEALDRLDRPGVDLLLLDLQLGDIDGVQVMEGARRRWPKLPIVMLTAHGSLPSAIAAVRSGAADYLLKPIGVDDLRERVGHVLSQTAAARDRSEQLCSMYAQMQAFLRSEGLLTTATSRADLSDVRIAGPVRLDVRRHTVTMRDAPMDITPAEFAILRELLGEPGAVVSCSGLARALNAAVDDEEEARQLIRPHIVRLRRKLEEDPQQPRYLISVRGVGYRWVADGSGHDG